LLKEDEVTIKRIKEFLYAEGKIFSQCSLTPASVIGWYMGRIIIYCVGYLISKVKPQGPGIPKNKGPRTRP
jgi:hypothetical protein